MRSFANDHRGKITGALVILALALSFWFVNTFDVRVVWGDQEWICDYQYKGMSYDCVNTATGEKIWAIWDGWPDYIPEVTDAPSN